MAIGRQFASGVQPAPRRLISGRSQLLTLSITHVD